MLASCWPHDSRDAVCVCVCVCVCVYTDTVWRLRRWGSFIRHVWGGPGVELRRRAFDDELKVQGVWRRRQFERLVEQAQATWTDMPC
jgi:hypothetical protein